MVWERWRSLGASASASAPRTARRRGRPRSVAPSVSAARSTGTTTSGSGADDAGRRDGGLLDRRPGVGQHGGARQGGLVHRDVGDVHEQGERQPHDGLRALVVRAGLEADLRAQPGGDPADHEQAQALGAEHVARGRRLDLVLRLGPLRGGHAQAAVQDRDEHVALVAAGGHVHRGARLGEHRRVLQQLGEQVRGRQGGVAQHPRVDRQVDLDTLVVLDLRRRGADHVGQQQRLAQLAPGVDAGQHQEGLGVPPHPGGEVVQPEQVRQRGRVLLGALEGVDEGQLPVEQDLVATRHVDEHLGDRPTQGGLLLGDLQRGRVHVVERGGQAAHLVAADDRDLGDRQVRGLAGHGRLLHQGGQPVTHRGRGGGQATHRTDDRPGDGQRDDHREQRRGCGAGDGEDGLTLGGGSHHVGACGRAGVELDLRRGHQADLLEGRRDPLVGLPLGQRGVRHLADGLAHRAVAGGRGGQRHLGDGVLEVVVVQRRAELEAKVVVVRDEARQRGLETGVPVAGDDLTAQGALPPVALDQERDVGVRREHLGQVPVVDAVGRRAWAAPRSHAAGSRRRSPPW